MLQKKSDKANVLIVLVVMVMLALVAGIGCAGLSAYAESNATKETRVAHFTDIHVMPVSYSNLYSKNFDKAASSTKLLVESEAALQTALAEVYNDPDAPQIILFSGDLTSNGELEAHKVVAGYLKELTAKMRTREGYEKFQIFVMPGNHDMYNDRAVSYMPTEEEFASCGSEEEVMALMTGYSPRSVETTTSKDIFEIYSDFGYCNCPSRKVGKHLPECGMADGTKLSFFYESDYWYDSETERVTTADGVEYKNFDVRPATKEQVNAYKDNGKDFEYLAEPGRIGLCSFIATLDGVTVVGMDGSAREYTDKRNNLAQAYADGWNETTGGMVTRDMLRWLVAETKDEVAADNLVLLDCHFNNIPHFTSQDEVISLFVLDNLELYNSALAEAGIRYSFSGHQHATDITNTVTQDGSILYDIETCSTISYGSAYRYVDFLQVWSGGDYYEKVTSTVYNLNNNAGGDGFYYGYYKLTSDLNENDEPLTEDAVCPEVFSVKDPNLYTGTDYLTLVKDCILDEDGEKVGLSDYLAIGMGKMITKEGVIGSVVNDGLYDKLKSSLSGIGEKYPYLGDLLTDLIDGLSVLDLPKLTVSSDGKTFTVSEGSVKGNDLVDFAYDLVDYLIGYDFSYGQIEGGVSLNEFLVIVYGGHLSGAHTNVMDKRIAPLIEKLRDGTFVDFLVSTLANSVVPQLDYLLNTPIRFDEATEELPEGVGFDITASNETAAKTGIDSVVKALLSNYCLKTTDENGYSSLKYIVGDLVKILEDLLFTEKEEINDGTLKFLSSLVRPLLSGLGNISKYVDMALAYIDEYFNVGSIKDVLYTELIDKYVTDAFCRNLGEYGAYILTGMNVDDTDDGCYWTEGDIMKKYCVKSVENFNITSDKCDADVVYRGFAYYRKKGTDGKLTVTPSADNGLLPSMISLSDNGDMSSTKKVTWFTSIDRSVFDEDEEGNFPVAESYIKYSEKADLGSATTVKATSCNMETELPTIDLGIMYFNLSHRTVFYNKHTVSLSDLKPSTKYYYAVGNDEYGWSEVYSFTTAKSGSFRFLAITDVQGSVEKNYTDSLPSLKKAVESFGDDNIAFIASMGDNVDNGKNVKQIRWWLEGQKEIWANNTLVTMAGNHEKSEYALSKMLSVPDTATAEETGLYYSYDYNNAHFVILNTNDVDDNKLSEKQTEWLVKDLEENNENKNTKWTIVMLHKGPYTAGSHAFDSDVIGLRAQLTPIFADNGVDLVLQGHDHTYSVSEFIGRDGKPVEVETSAGGVKKGQGVLYINLGTMGDKFYDYIYSDEVSIKKRSSVAPELEKYLTEDGYLELKETPVFADVEVTSAKLVIKTYTLIDGEPVLIDSITLNDGFEFTTSRLSAMVIAGVIVIAVMVLAIVLSCRPKKRYW